MTDQIDTKFNPHEWNPTMKLRWKETKIYQHGDDTTPGHPVVRILQQLWVSNSGESEWRAIPTEEQ